MPARCSPPILLRSQGAGDCRDLECRFHMFNKGAPRNLTARCGCPARVLLPKVTTLEHGTRLAASLSAVSVGAEFCFSELFGNGFRKRRFQLFGEPGLQLGFVFVRDGYEAKSEMPGS
jgi:hypothetical protein